MVTNVPENDEDDMQELKEISLMDKKSVKVKRTSTMEKSKKQSK